RHTRAWQSGITGIGYNTELVVKPPTQLAELMRNDFFPTSSGGRLKEDAPNLVMINLGIDPKSSQQPEWDQAAEWLTKLRDSAPLYNTYDQGHIHDPHAKNPSRPLAR